MLPCAVCLLSLPKLLLTASLCARAQAPQPPPSSQLSPQAAYQDALHPLQTTRNNIANWSEVEQAAMAVAVSKAKDSCLARHPGDYTGADLVDLARLCSLGQQWPPVVDAADRYIALPGPKPLLADASIARTEAHLRLKQEPEALGSALTLLQVVPYSADVAACVDEVLAYTRYVHTADALTLARARQIQILRALRSAAAPITAATATTPAQPPHALYADGLLLPTLLQLATRPAEAQDALGNLDKALPAFLPPDDALRIAQDRRRYALLGRPLPAIQPISSLSSPTNKLPAIPAHNTITALLLFPDWCAQCVHLGTQLPETVFKVEGRSAYLYALLAQTTPARKPDPTVTNTVYHPAYAAALLAETPTVTVSPDTLTRFEAEDFPLLILTDDHGILRVLEPVTAQDLQPGGDLDAAIALVGRNFGTAPKSGPTTPPAGH